MTEIASDFEKQELKKILDGINFNGSHGKGIPLEERSGLFESPDQMLRHELKRDCEKTEKWLQKNYPHKTKQPRQLTEDPNSGTFI